MECGIRMWCTSTLVFWTWAGASFSAGAERPPNVVFILTDNQARGRWVATAIRIFARHTSTGLPRKGSGSLVP